MNWLIVILVILFILIGLCFLRLKVRIVFVQEGSKFDGKIVLRILGILGYTIKIPKTKDKVRGKLKSRKLLRKGKEIKVPAISRLLGFAKTFFQINIWLIKHINCSRFTWKTRVGLGDAAVTGISGGMLWSIKGIIYSYLQKTLYSRTCTADINVTPVFNEETISTELDCIFNLRMGYIIIACIRLLILAVMIFLVLKGVKQHERPSY